LLERRRTDIRLQRDYGTIGAVEDNANWAGDARISATAVVSAP
jgi:hypothetical protein